MNFSGENGDTTETYLALSTALAAHDEESVHGRKKW